MVGGQETTSDPIVLMARHAEKLVAAVMVRHIWTLQMPPWLRGGCGRGTKDQSARLCAWALPGRRHSCRMQT